MPPTQPLLTIGAVQRALSEPRLRGYGDPTADPVATVAKYLWNLSLASAIRPALHILEVTLRNELYGVSKRILKLDKRAYEHQGIDTWLDADPTWLEKHEKDKVDRAKTKLGSDAGSQTEGHLIAKLDLGFWTALCRHPYSDWRAAGPRLWPRALHLAFRSRPPEVATRRDVHDRLDGIREFRNRVAHQEPIWDRNYLLHHERIVETIGWMNPSVAEAVRVTSPAPAAFRGGPEHLRPFAESLVGTGPGIETTLQYKLARLDSGQRTLVEGLVDRLLGGGEELQNHAEAPA
jgi:hypothetical protein